MTKTYAAVYGKMFPQYILIITIPLVIIAICTGILLSLPNLGDVLLYALIILSMAISVVLIKWSINTVANVPAHISVTSEGIQIFLQKKSLFYAQATQNFLWPNIKNISNNFDPQHDFETVLIQPKQGGTIQLTADKNTPTDFDTLWNLMEEWRKNYNENNQGISSETITDVGLYHTPFAKAITWLVIISNVVIAFLLLTKTIHIPTYKVIGFYAISLGWLVKVTYDKVQK